MRAISASGDIPTHPSSRIGTGITARFGRGERFVSTPIGRDEYDRLMQDVRRWKLDDMIEENDFDRIALSIA